MPVKRSSFTDVALRVAEKLKAKSEKAAKARPVPFGMERVGLETARQRVRNMTPEERATLVQQVGLEAALKLFKPYGRDDDAGS